MKVLEIVCLENGDVVLVEVPTDANGDVIDSPEPLQDNAEQVQQQPLVSIRFSPEVRDMLGDDAFGVAEAMIEAATAYISDETGSQAGDFGGELGSDLGAESGGASVVEFVQGGEGRRESDRINPELDDFEDQVSTTPVVLH